MELSTRTVLLGADTPRARAYLGAIERADLGPIAVLQYGPPAPVGPPRAGESSMLGGLWLPDLTTPVAALCARNNWPHVHLDTESINAPGSVAALQASKADLVIFAGRPGEIVSRRVLAASPPILHCHPGALPEQRGSTTLYYSILERRPITVSGLLLAAEIDAGPVVYSKQYPWPPPGLDLDHLFDAAVRADTLVEILCGPALWRSARGARADVQTGVSYFVIHPVLKQLAILAVQRGECARS